ncbi:trans-sulfuration enzyme family protein [Marinithermus hydrothermalis]|uniref:Cystathionine gamma-synthase n=1 Tax=Marinithermus hydrothermalis (strain DSM 14884 / JCM 11576 / T1) TaxID=869210 RepID=F2NMM5_MARHT|nr:PLP-dependent aspartate aminotransferase family protein [Marinithermus hydrothermalis]AEB12409.1 Cystathionine gamma-synthase [Marinithermus hydrothermalis DSM 14884]
MKTKRFRTRAVHSGQRPDPLTGAHATPIYQTSTFAYGSFDRGARLFAGEETGFLYSRIGNPTTRSFEEKLADLEGAEDAVAFASGMAAVSALALTLLRPGDEVVFIGPLYGGTEGFFLDVLARFGVTITDATGYESLEAALSPATRMIYVETPSNPTLRITDLAEVARIGRARGILTVADNTFATPYLTRPLEHGIDLVLHSATKYLGGHGDAVGGILAGPKEIVDQVRAEGLRHVGGSLGPLESYLFLRGMKTLPLRMEAHCDGAEAVAAYLKAHPLVRRVHYPGLPEHPNHAVAARQMRRFGGMVSFELEGGARAARAFLDSLELFLQAVSLGDVESLATHPASTTHQLLPPDVLERQGVTDGLVRLSIGIEDPEDLIADLEQALARVEQVLERAG